MHVREAGRRGGGEVRMNGEIWKETLDVDRGEAYRDAEGGNDVTKTESNRMERSLKSRNREEEERLGGGIW